MSDEQPTVEQKPTPKRLTRTGDDRMVAGVAGGLGRYFDVDPVIFRIAFVASIFFGGLGGLIYIAGILFMPVDDGTGEPVRSARLEGIARVVAVVILAFFVIGVFGILVAAAGFLTGIGWGIGVVGLIVLLGVALIASSFRGGSRWLIVPALALTIGSAGAAAADLDLDGGIGQRDYRPESAAAIPADGYELGIGRLTVDLRAIDWSPRRVVHLDVRVGAGQAVVAVPSDVCVVADAHAGAGDLRIAGQESSGFDADSTTAGGSRATPRLELNADVDMGQVRVVNDDSFDITDEHRFDRWDDEDMGAQRAANERACTA
jgi:phage shock protein PspC (stress-responsive transcriptional regulator)